MIIIAAIIIFCLLAFIVLTNYDTGAEKRTTKRTYINPTSDPSEPITLHETIHKTNNTVLKMDLDQFLNKDTAINELKDYFKNHYDGGPIDSKDIESFLGNKGYKISSVKTSEKPYKDF